MADLLPTFLVIGAMKAGTTSLCRDLEASPDVFFPTVKEPHTLCLDQVTTPVGRRRYAALFRHARPEQQRGEGSTGYTKLPQIKGVVDRALTVLGPSLKLVYIVRDPIDRIVSHHRHRVRGGDGPADINEAVRTLPELVDVSRYALQLDPWLRAFGRENVCVVRFEEYIARRAEEIERVCTFLDVEPPTSTNALEVIHNAGTDALLPPRGIRALSRTVTRSQFYKRVIHPRTPAWVRDRLKAAVYTPSETPISELTPAKRAWLVDQLADDAARFSEMIGQDGPWWESMQPPTIENEVG